MSKYNSVLVSVLASSVLLGLAACASEHKTTSSTTSSAAPSSTSAPMTHAKISNEVNATAKVVALDKSLRLVTLRSEDGRLTDVYCSDEVRNYDQIGVGDSLRVRYRQSLSASLLPPGSDAAVSHGSVTATRAEKGAAPAAGVNAHYVLRVKVVSLDAPREVVVFSLPSGELVAHQIATAEGREFVKHVKVGDLVELDYSEALALSIEEMKSAG